MHSFCKEPPHSTYHHRARELITVVLKEKNYEKAISMVRDEEVPVDAHTGVQNGENTLLTEAARIGDLKAVKLAVETLNASIDTSCHCPLFMSALHYASEGGHVEVAKYLIDKRAHVNILNYLGQTPLDVAKASNQQKVVDLLISRGGITHKEKVNVWKEGFLSLWKEFTGFGPKDLVKLPKAKPPKTLEKKIDVIHLPPPDRKDKK